MTTRSAYDFNTTSRATAQPGHRPERRPAATARFLVYRYYEEFHRVVSASSGGPGSRTRSISSRGSARTSSTTRPWRRPSALSTAASAGAWR
ncbi:MAG: hypothetical protein MZV70_34525 [Desulfobacterales bacterium]|nr:hypothetical protein [Desulfobacterales bacterium]